MSAVAPHRAQHSAEGARIPASPYTPKERALIQAELYAVKTCVDEYVLRVIVDELWMVRRLPGQAPLKGGTP